MIIEYVPDPTFYPEGMSIEEIAQLDANTEEKDLLFEGAITNEVEWEIIERKC